MLLTSVFTAYACYQQRTGQILTSIVRRASDDNPGHGDCPGRVAERDVGGGHDGTQVAVQTVYEDEGHANREDPACPENGLTHTELVWLVTCLDPS